jgi:uncharacterized protein
LRLVFLYTGYLFFALGFIGAFLPVLPTTPFMLLALMCFSKGSPKLHDWLLNHRIFGPPLQKWEENRVISIKVKVFAVSVMLLSQLYLYIFVSLLIWIKISSSALILYGCYFILTKPSNAKV